MVFANCFLASTFDKAQVHLDVLPLLSSFNAEECTIGVDWHRLSEKYIQMKGIRCLLFVSNIIQCQCQGHVTKRTVGRGHQPDKQTHCASFKYCPFSYEPYPPLTM